MNAIAGTNMMLFKKSWWETRFMLLVTIVVLVAFALWIGLASFDATEWSYKLQRNAALTNADRQSLDNFQGRMWTIWFKSIIAWVWTLYSILLGAACHIFTAAYAPSQTAIPNWTLSLPITRRRMLLTQATMAFGEVVLLAIVPSLLLSAATRLRGMEFSFANALLYSLLTVGGGAVFFGASYLLALLIRNWLVGAAITAAVAGAAVGFLESIDARPAWSPFTVMAGDSYFFHGHIPWLGVLISLGLCLLFVHIGVRIYEGRDL